MKLLFTTRSWSHAIYGIEHSVECVAGLCGVRGFTAYPPPNRGCLCEVESLLRRWLLPRGYLGKRGVLERCIQGDLLDVPGSVLRFLRHILLLCNGVRLESSRTARNMWNSVAQPPPTVSTNLHRCRYAH